MTQEQERYNLVSARVTSAIQFDEVAQHIGVSPDLLQIYELNPEVVPVSTAVSLARLYGLSIDDISFR